MRIDNTRQPLQRRRRSLKHRLGRSGNHWLISLTRKAGRVASWIHCFIMKVRGRVLFDEARWSRRRLVPSLSSRWKSGGRRWDNNTLDLNSTWKGNNVLKKYLCPTVYSKDEVNERWCEKESLEIIILVRKALFVKVQEGDGKEPLPVESSILLH